MTELPSGTVTFLFTDLEGSTRLWEAHPDAMRAALARHDELVDGAITDHDGRIVKHTGDGVHAVFTTADDAVRAAVVAQRALASEDWAATDPLTVRMGLHTGTAELRDGDYYGTTLNRAARLMSVAHGGQIVVSQITQQLVIDALDDDLTFTDLGEHRLRDLEAPMRVFQVTHPDLGQSFPALRSMDATHGNLPVHLSSFVGRDGELDRVRGLLRHRRLLTLTGVGGVGKTRLALQAAADELATFPGGAWLVELARTGDPGAVVAVAFAALDAAPQPGRPEIDIVCDQIGATRTLVILDNCEHLLDVAADFVETLLDRCAGVFVLATSREPLDLDGEQVVPVRPLDPATDALVLFAERARDVDPAFDADDAATADAIREICRRLDGVPLAVELAAAHVATMTPSTIASGLDDRFRLLASGRRRSVDRHQTLRATLEWSHHLLNEPERVLLRRLGVFAGGFRAWDVAVVCGFDDQVVDEHRLAALVRQSLVQFERDPAPGRYRLLETVRVFALEQLAAHGEADSAGRAHAEWMAGIVGHPITVWMTEGAIDHEAVDQNLDNWREAVGYAVAQRDLDLARVLNIHTRGASVPETLRWAEEALTLDGMDAVPGAHWIRWGLAGGSAAAMDPARLEVHMNAFDAGCRDADERGFGAPFHAIHAATVGDDGLVYIEQALEAELQPLTAAYLHVYRSLWRNLPPRSDPEAAHLAVRLAEEVGATFLAVAEAFLAFALRDEPDAAIAALERAEELAFARNDAFATASVVSWGSMALLSLPVDVAARHLAQRLNRLQPYWNNPASALLTTCLRLLRRADDPAAIELHRFLWSTAGSAAVARSMAPDVESPPPSDDPPLEFEDTLTLTRAALARLATSPSR